jgi:hypothetical protein
VIIALDESGVHESKYLVIGALFIPSPGPLHRQLSDVKRKHNYINTNPRHSATYRELKYSGIGTTRDVDVAKEWIDIFLTSCTESGMNAIDLPTPD